MSQLRSTKSMIGACFDVIIELHARLTVAGFTDALGIAAAASTENSQGGIAEFEAFRSKCRSSFGTVDCHAAVLSLEAAYQSGRCRLAPLEPSNLDFARSLEAVAPTMLQAFCERDCASLASKVALACDDNDFNPDVFVSGNLMVAR
jgi:hypothetical protein